MKQPGPCNICWFLILVSFCVTVTSKDITLNQVPNFAYALLNQETEIKCDLKGISLDNLRICWYKETPSSGNVEFIVCAHFGPKNSYTFGQISQDKLEIKKGNFQGSSILKIKDLQYLDSGNYYCMVDSIQKLYFGDGTSLRVVETFPTTVPPATKKPQCKCSKSKPPREAPPGVSCSPVIWAPVAGFAVILIIGLYFLATHTCRVYRRTHMYFRKYSPNK